MRAWRTGTIHRYFLKNIRGGHGHWGCVADRLMEAALALVAERGWQALSLVEVAKRAELPLLDCYRIMPNKAALLRRLIVAADEAVLQEGVADPEEKPRDRLFDVLMRRFDALQTRRVGTVAILRGLPLDPTSIVGLLPRLVRSFVWMLETAGVTTNGLSGALHIKVLGIVYLYVLRVWVEDDTPDIARTMAALDKALRCVERLIDRFPSGLHFGQLPKLPPHLMKANRRLWGWLQRFVTSAPAAARFTKCCCNLSGIVAVAEPRTHDRKLRNHLIIIT